MPSLLKLLLLTIAFISTCDGLAVSLYSSTQQNGKQLNLEVPGCVNLKNYDLCDCGAFFSSPTCINAADSVESIDTRDNCVRVYRKEDCEERVGPRIEPGSGCHSNWGDDDCGFKNDIQSISPCDEKCINPAHRLALQSHDTTEAHILRDQETVIHVSFTHIDGVKVPTFLETFLWTTISGRAEFQGSYWTRRFEAMKGRSDTDVKGHLLASSLGGPAEDWNFAPQRTEINNGDGTGQGWKSLELQIKNHLERHSCSYVYWQQIVQYDETPRPDAFTVNAYFYETWYDKLVNVEAVTIQCFNRIPSPLYDGAVCHTTRTRYPDGRPDINNGDTWGEICPHDELAILGLLVNSM